MGRVGRPADNGAVTWVPLHVTALAAVAEQGEGIAIRARKLREQAELCPGNSAARGVAEEALLRFGGALRARTAELKAFYEANILEDLSVLFERERLRLQRLLVYLEAPLQVRPPIKALPVNAPDQLPAQSLGALLRKRTGALTTVHSAPSTPKGTSRRRESFVPPQDAPPVLQLPAKPALRLHSLRGQNGLTSPRGDSTSSRGSASPRTGSPPPSIFRNSATSPTYVPSPLQGVSFPEPSTPPAAPAGRKFSKKHSFVPPEPTDRFLPLLSDNDPGQPFDEGPARDKEADLYEQSRGLPSKLNGRPLEMNESSAQLVELVVKLTAAEFDELMRMAKERTQET